jgi:hypothetical protein
MWILLTVSDAPLLYIPMLILGRPPTRDGLVRCGLSL